MEDYYNYDNDNKTRTYEQSNSTISFSHISKKLRRGSFFVHWDSALDITPQLKKLEKSRLCLSQTDFSALEYQLYSSWCLTVKQDRVYTYAARHVEFNNVVYTKLIRYLNVWNVLNLCIWRYHNTTETVPSAEFVALFERSYELEDDINPLVIKQMTIKINNKYTLRRVLWTVHQRQAATNTRDHFIYGFEPRYPMMSDLTWTQSNNNMVREFIIGLLRANVDIQIINDVCFEQLVKEKTGKKIVLEHKYNPLERTKENMPVQRSSITDFSPLTTEVVAAIRLQRAYRKRLETLKDAVRRIERAWEPRRLENIEIRLEIAQGFEEAVNQMEERNVDVFQYKELVDEIKEDYKTVRRPETRTNMYWSKVIMILTVPVAIGILVGRWNGYDNGIIMLICYVALQYLTVYRKLWKVLWFQTLILWLLTVIILNNGVTLIQNGWIRIPVWVVLVALGRKHWITLFLMTLVIRVGLTLFYDMFSIQPMEYGLAVYDFYCMATIAAASRQGTPIEMLHKVMINMFFLTIIGFNVASGYLFVGTHQ